MGTPEFSRARSDEQREQRREAILATAEELVARSRVADLSLNELARRVGLAKSNVLRYFPSREAVLLALLDRRYAEWLDAVEAALDEECAGDGGAPRDAAGDAPDRIAAILARTAAARPVLCELVATSTLVLEHNVSGEVAAEYKRRALAEAERLVLLIETALGRLDDEGRLVLAAGVNLALGGTWAMCRPSPGMSEAYRAHPELTVFRLDFETSMRGLVATLLTGLVARAH